MMGGEGWNELDGEQFGWLGRGAVGLGRRGTVELT